MKNTETEKYKIGDEVVANWAGGRITRHVITGIKNTDRGYWYTWKSDAKDTYGSGLHEQHLNKAHK